MSDETTLTSVSMLMRLAIFVIRWSSAPVIVWIGLVFGVLFRQFAVPGLVVLILAPLSVVASFALATLGWRVVQRRVSRASEAEDPKTLRWIAERLREGLTSGSVGQIVALDVEASAAMLEDRFDVARALLDRVVAASRTPRMRVAAQNNLAWAITFAGDADAGVALARNVVAASAILSPESRALCRGTLGVALQVAGHPAESLALLDEAVAAGGKPRAQAIRHFHRGEALRALGRVEEARVAYESAERASPKSRWAEKARAAKTAAAFR